MPALALDCNSPAVGTVGIAYNHTFTITGGTPPYNLAAVSVPIIRGSNSVSGSSAIATVPLPAGTLAGDFALIFSASAFDCSVPAGWTLVTTNWTGGTWNGFAASKVLSSGDIIAGSVSVNSASFDPVGSTLAIVTFIGATGGVREQYSNRSAGVSPIDDVFTTTGAILNTDAGVYFASARGGPTSNTIPGSGTVNALQDVTTPYGMHLSDQAMPGGVSTVTVCYLTGPSTGFFDAAIFVEGVSSVLNPLPPGLSLDPTTGILSGVPTAPGTYTFTLQLLDTTQCGYATIACSVTIASSAPVVVSCNTPPSGITGVSYTHNFTVAGGTPPYTWAISSGALPDGVTLDSATGIASGTPTVASTFHFTVQVTDSLAQVGTAACSIVITLPISIICDNPPSGVSGIAYDHAFPASGGTPPYTFSITAGALPTGLSLNTSTGLVSGVPTLQAVFSFTIQVVDSLEHTASVSCSITILPPRQVVGQNAFWALVNGYMIKEDGEN